MPIRPCRQTRRRDLRSAVNCFAALTDNRPSLIPLDLAAIRAVLDLMVPIQAKVSRKRWANLRSDLAAAIAGSGLLPMLKTASVELSETWLALFDKVSAPRLRHGLSRFARWASERQIGPTDITKAGLDQFIAELLEGSLVRKIITLRQNIVRSWNSLHWLPARRGLATNRGDENPTSTTSLSVERVADRVSRRCGSVPRMGLGS